MDVTRTRTRLAAVALAGLLAGAAQAGPPDIDALAEGSAEDFVAAARLAVAENDDFVLLFTRVDPALGPMMDSALEDAEWIALERELVECLHAYHARHDEMRLLARYIASMYEVGAVIRENPDFSMLTFMSGEVPPAFEATAFSPEDEAFNAAAFEHCMGESDFMARAITPEMATVVGALAMRMLEAQGIPTEDLPPDFFSPEMLQQMFEPGMMPQ